MLQGCCLAAVSCMDLLQPEIEGEIIVDFDRAFFSGTKASDIPDADDFILKVTDSGGKEVYYGPYSSSPETIIVSPGNYTVTAVSRDFDEPLYDAPQYGDTQVVSVTSGNKVGVTLNCHMLNCGIRIIPDDYFRTAYPEAVLYLKGPGGLLMYGYSEKRTAYFLPGCISLTMVDKGAEQVLFTRTLEAQEMFSLGVSATLDDRVTSGGVSLQIDTARFWTGDRIVVGGGAGEDGIDGAYTVREAGQHVGEIGVWVQGFMVGVATGTGRYTFSPPFGKNTNVVIGLRTNSTIAGYLLAVELKKGELRESVNLMDNPGLLGRKIFLKGDIVESYYGTTGLKNVSGYRME